MRKMKFFLICGLTLLGTAAVSSCSQDGEDVVPQGTESDGQAKTRDLGLEFDIWAGQESAITETRAIKSGTAFATGDKIGYYVTNSGGTALYNSTSANLLATKAASSWTLATGVPLSATAAKVYAYYPYSSSTTATVAGMKTVACATGTSDYLWGVSSSTMTASSATANITMKHALSQIRFTFTCSNSPNACVVTNATIQDASTTVTCYKSGTYDITTGTITNGTAGSTSLAISSGNFKSSTVTSAVLMFPMTIAASTVKVTFTIDGGTYTMNVPAITWEAGKIYTYPVQMVGNNLVLNASGITITDWTNGSTASATTFS